MKYMLKTQRIALVITALITVASCTTSTPSMGSPGNQTTIPVVTEQPTSTVVVSTSTPDPEKLIEADELLLAPALKARFSTNSTTAGDKQNIELVQNNHVYPIEGLLFDSLKNADQESESLVYVLIDEITGNNLIVASYDVENNIVIESSTGYPLNVRSDPGIIIEKGSDGREIYWYGFAWYPRWERILPEPVIQLLEDFYSVGILYVENNLDRFQTVADPNYFGGALTSLTWDDNLISRLNDWAPISNGAPFIILPDSGTIDISDKSFLSMLDNERIIVNQNLLNLYVISTIPSNSYYNSNQTEASVTSMLLDPFQRPDRFSDLQKLFIIGGVLDTGSSFALNIDFSLNGGFFVPGSGAKRISIAPYEVDLMFGFNGIYYSKLAHEFSHYIVFRETDFISDACLLNEAEIVETIPYILEFMWWVQEYPNDAPHWDWEIINSGLVLSNLVNSNFNNFKC